MGKKKDRREVRERLKHGERRRVRGVSDVSAGMHQHSCVPKGICSNFFVKLPLLPEP